MQNTRLIGHWTYQHPQKADYSLSQSKLLPAIEAQELTTSLPVIEAQAVVLAYPSLLLLTAILRVWGSCWLVYLDPVELLPWESERKPTQHTLALWKTTPRDGSEGLIMLSLHSRATVLHHQHKQGDFWARGLQYWSTQMAPVCLWESHGRSPVQHCHSKCHCESSGKKPLVRGIIGYLWETLQQISIYAQSNTRTPGQ